MGYCSPVRKQKITKTYATRRDRLVVTFPAAHAFLTDLEGDRGLWLSTATNAHLYSGDRFLAYIKVNAPEARPPSLLLSPRFNNRIVAGTKDASHLLFRDTVEALRSEADPAWWTTRSRGAIELSSGTPPRFFDDLMNSLRSL